jgi:hypothetical protein
MYVYLNINILFENNMVEKFLLNISINIALKCNTNITSHHAMYIIEVRVRENNFSMEFHYYSDITCSIM